MPFNLEGFLAGDNYIYEHTFTEKPFDGFSVKYRQTPENIVDLLAEEFTPRLDALGCPDAKYLVRWVLSPGVKPGEDALKNLTAPLLKWVGETTDSELLTICRKLIPAAIIRHSLGEWNHKTAITTDVVAALPEKLKVMLNRLIAEANTGGIEPDKAAFLPK